MIAAALVFLFASVLVKLGRDWWTDENYSHGLLVPFVIAFLIWSERDRLQRAIARPSAALVGGVAVCSILLLLVGTVASELFTQRISFLLALLGDGFAKTLETRVKGMLDTDGLLSARTDGINRTIKSFDARIESLEARLVRVEARYSAQFTALDAAMSSMNTTSAYLTQQLANL